MNKNIKFTVVILGSLLLFSFVFIKSISENEIAASDGIGNNMVDIERKVIHIDATELLLPDDNSKLRTTPITHVLLHFSSNVAANPSTPFQIEDIQNIFLEYGLSAHYVIDREGELFRLVPETRVAYHAGAGSLRGFPTYKDDLNAHSIGVELLAIGTKEEMAGFISEENYDALDPSFIGYTDAQYETLSRLLDAFHNNHPDIKRDRNHIIGHDEYAPTRKVDPGELFDWSRIGYDE